MKNHFEKMIVAYDQSPGSQNALNLAINLKKTYPESQLIIAHVVQEKINNIPVNDEKPIQPVRTNGFMLEGMQVPPVAVEYDHHHNTSHAKIENSVDQVLFHVKEKLNGENIKAKYELLEGDSADSLCEFAATQNANVIIIGNSSKSDIRKLILGSITEKVVKNAHCHVLIAK